MMSNFESEFNILKKENLALELQLQGKLDQEETNIQEVQNLRQKNESTASAAKEEVEGMKKQMQIVDQYVRKLENDLADEGAQNERTIKDLDIYKKKYQEAKVEAQTAYKGLESYQTILTKFEENL